MPGRILRLKKSKNLIRLLLAGSMVILFILTAVACDLVATVTEDRDVSDFNKVIIGGSGNLYIEQGEEESLTIKTTKNIISYINTEVSGDTLEIGIEQRGTVVPVGVANYYLTVKDLDVIIAAGSANVSSSQFNTNNLEITMSGSGNVKLAGRVEKQTVLISGSGNYSAKDFISRDCVIVIAGSGNGSVNVTDSLDVNISGSGNVSYIGNPSVNKTISGSGSVKSVTK